VILSGSTNISNSLKFPSGTEAMFVVPAITCMYRRVCTAVIKPNALLLCVLRTFTVLIKYICGSYIFLC
jgi:hypothetical protein